VKIKHALSLVFAYSAGNNRSRPEDLLRTLDKCKVLLTLYMLRIGTRIWNRLVKLIGYWLKLDLVNTRIVRKKTHEEYNIFRNNVKYCFFVGALKHSAFFAQVSPRVCLSALSRGDQSSAVRASRPKRESPCWAVITCELCLMWFKNNVGRIALSSRLFGIWLTYCREQCLFLGSIITSLRRNGNFSIGIVLIICTPKWFQHDLWEILG